MLARNLPVAQRIQIDISLSAVRTMTVNAKTLDERPNFRLKLRLQLRAIRLLRRRRRAAHYQ
jgi:hypothetical protein